MDNDKRSHVVNTSLQHSSVIWAITYDMINADSIFQLKCAVYYDKMSGQWICQKNAIDGTGSYYCYVMTPYLMEQLISETDNDRIASIVSIINLFMY